jgi:hypothetical protein
MEWHQLIADIASRADDFLAGATSREQGRAGIEEYINLEHFHLTPEQRRQVTDGVMSTLEAEDFFDTEFVGDPFKDDEASDD